MEKTFGFLIELLAQRFYMLIVVISCTLKSCYQNIFEGSEKIKLGPIVLLVAAFMNLSVTVIEPASAPANEGLATNPTGRAYRYYTQVVLAL